MTFRRLVLALAVAALIVLAYANHFHNSFHFDDVHAITKNPAIRQVSNIPRFFADARTFSIEEKAWTYRPVVSASVAIDYWLGNGLHPEWFHASTLVWLLVAVALIFLFFGDCLDRVKPSPANFGISLFAAALYGVHPVLAETVNYIIQRADLYVVVGVVAGLVLYARLPLSRRYGLYLIPVLFAILSKPTALVFPVLLLIWLRLFDNASWPAALRRALPSLGFAAVAGYFSVQMTPPQFNPNGLPAASYRLTQPAVLFHYFREFFLPLHLSADTDRTIFSTPFAPEALAGFLFLAFLIAAIWLSLRGTETRVVAFGLIWFLVASFPTSFYSLGELENDHRMCFPFVGLSLAVCVAVASLVDRFGLNMRFRLAVCLLILAAMAWGTRQRNEVWKTDESLWLDATRKSPKNPRAWVNYGVNLMNRNDFAGGLTAFETAKALGPTTPNLMRLTELNLAVAFASLGSETEARRHYEKAIELWPGVILPRYKYASWLHFRGYDDEAVGQLKLILGQFPTDEPSRLLLIETHVQRAGVMAGNGNFAGCLSATRDALAINAEAVGAWQGAALCHLRLREWDEAITAAQRALRIHPDLPSSREVLEEALTEKKRLH